MWFFVVFLSYSVMTVTSSSQDFCLVCKGVGVVDGLRTVNVEIPAGEL